MQHLSDEYQVKWDASAQLTQGYPKTGGNTCCVCRVG